MPSPYIGRRITPEYTAKTKNYNPQLGQVGRGATPSYAVGNSACVGAFDSVTVTFAGSTSGTVTVSVSLPNVKQVTLSAYDVCQAHITPGAVSLPSGVTLGQLSFQLTAVNKSIPPTNVLSPGTQYAALGVTASGYVTASGAFSFAVPVSVLFLGNVVNA